MSGTAGRAWRNTTSVNSKRNKSSSIPSFSCLSDTKHSDAETRYHAFGRTAAGRLLEVSFTMRHNATLVRVISTRSVSRRERLRYEQET